MTEVLSLQGAIIISASNVKKNSETHELAKQVLTAIRGFLLGTDKEEWLTTVTNLETNAVAIELIEKRLVGEVYTRNAERLLIHDYFHDFYKFLDEQSLLAKYRELLPLDVMKQIMAWELVSVWRMSRDQIERVEDENRGEKVNE